MKKIMAFIGFIALTINIAHAADQVMKKNDQTGVMLNESSNKTNKEYLHNYFELKVGKGRQLASGVYTTSENRITSGKTDLDFSSNLFSIILGVDYYETPNKIPIRFESATTLRSSGTVSYLPKVGSNYKIYTGGMNVGLDTIMLNFYYDFHNESKVTPYVMVGVGGAMPFSVTDNITGSNSRYFYPIKTSALSFVWSTGVGFLINITPQFAIDVGTVYTQTGNTSTTYEDNKLAYNPTYSIDGIGALDVTLGIKLNF